MNKNIIHRQAPDIEYHYYALVFKTAYSEKSQYIGCEENRVSLKQINDAKLSCDMPKDAMLVACSYLGKFASEEFTAE